MVFNTLISIEILAAHLDDPGWILVDCRFDLQNPGWGLEEYRRGHIPGAVYAHLNNNLSAPVTPSTGRHPLPEPVDFKALLSAWGVDSTKQVVAYDSAGGAYAARLWWLLRFYRHPGTAVLDGGFARWLAENRPTRPGIESNPPSWFEGTPDPSMMVSASEVDRIRLDPGFRLIDARTRSRFMGEGETIDPVAGHIPGAVNHFYGMNLKPDGTFKAPETLRTRFEGILGSVRSGNAVVYCGSGVTACHHLLAMEHAGLNGARLYSGSWSEWIRDPNRPRTTGPV